MNSIEVVDEIADLRKRVRELEEENMDLRETGDELKEMVECPVRVPDVAQGNSSDACVQEWPLCLSHLQRQDPRGGRSGGGQVPHLPWTH